jgi:hypothetical protein
MPDPLSGASERDRYDILEAVAALRTSGQPIEPWALRALHDPRLRDVAEAVLRRAGRVLVSDPAGRLSLAYDDAVADELVARGIGVLDETDRAVLCLVLLVCVAAPRARGQTGDGDDWSAGQRVTSDNLLARYRGGGLTREAITDSITRLKHLGLLRAGQDLAPGPALARLTPQRRAQLWEDLVLICAPDTHRAMFIRTRRSQEPIAS